MHAERLGFGLLCQCRLGSAASRKPIVSVTFVQVDLGYELDMTGRSSESLSQFRPRSLSGRTSTGSASFCSLPLRCPSLEHQAQSDVPVGSASFKLLFKTKLALAESGDAQCDPDSESEPQALQAAPVGSCSQRFSLDSGQGPMSRRPLDHQRPAPRSILLVIWLVAAGVGSGCLLQLVQSATSTQQAAALRDLYGATNGAAWVSSSNWLTGDPCTSNWAGVTCSGSPTDVQPQDVT
jgi:hypothetical protein